MAGGLGRTGHKSVRCRTETITLLLYMLYPLWPVGLVTLLYVGLGQRDLSAGIVTISVACSLHLVHTVTQTCVSGVELECQADQFCIHQDVI